MTTAAAGSTASIWRPASSNASIERQARCRSRVRTISSSTRRVAFTSAILARFAPARWIVARCITPRPTARITEVAFPMITPNGVGLSPDEKTLYVAETESARLWAFDIVEPGVVKKHPWPSAHGGRLVAGVGGFQRFDSLALDAAGRICVATLFNGGVTVISPDGRHVEHHPMPDLMTTNICFGGPDLKTAFVTLSWTGQLVTVDWPVAGLKLNWSDR